MIADLLTGLGRANLAAGAAILLILLLRGPLRRRFGARVAYALWLVAPLAAAAALLPQPVTDTVLSPVILTANAAARAVVPSALGADRVLLGLFAVWLTGALIAAGLLVRGQARFMASLGRLEPLAGEPGVLRAEKTRVGPAVVGAFRPRIVAPADFETRFDVEERGVILAHERVHLVSGDAPINALAAAAQCVAWFNPLVHLATYLMRIDQELACDAAVLDRFPNARRLYGELLLKTQLAAQPLPFGCHWPAGSAHPLKERILMLKSPLPGRGRKFAGLMIVTALGLGGACAAWAAQPAAVAPRFVTAPVWTQRPTGEDVASAYPKAMRTSGVEGRAAMVCRIDDDGRLQDCAVAVEEPLKAGFGPATLKLAKRFRMKPLDGAGEPVSGAQIRIPVMFRLPQS